MEGAASGNLAIVIQNLQMALTFEPDNDLFKEKLEEAKTQRDA